MSNQRVSKVSNQVSGLPRASQCAFPLRASQEQSKWQSTYLIDTVTLYLGPAAQEAYYNAILDLKPRRIIFNPGTENPILNQLAIQKGIETIDACTLVMLKTGQY